MKLNQIIATEKGIKARTLREVTEVYKTAQKPALLNGVSRTYAPVDEAGEKLPPESQRVQITSGDMLRHVQMQLSELFDVEATKEYGNCGAKADVIVEGKVILKDVPVTLLLFLEKQLTDLHTFAGSIPTLDPTESWTLDQTTGTYRTSPIATVKTKKIQKALVLYPATEQHPAQAQLITDDVTAGTWTTVRQSGAMPEPARKALSAKIEKLQNAVKFAREEANGLEIEQKAIADKVFGWLFTS